MRHRSVIEIMVLTFTFVVGFSLIMTGVVVAIVEIRNPEADTSTIVQSLISLISGILGALLGLIAGKNSSSSSTLGNPEDLEKRKIE